MVYMIGLKALIVNLEKILFVHMDMFLKTKSQCRFADTKLWTCLEDYGYLKILMIILK